MANQSIYKAFERMWQHIVAKFNTKVDTTEYEEYKEEADNNMSMIGISLNKSLTIAELPYLISEPDTTNWTSFTYGDGKYLAVGIGVVSTSTDGVNWSAPIRLPVNGLYNMCAYGNGKFVLISNDNELGVPVAVYSEDAITWNYCELPISDWDDSEIYYYDIAFSNDQFVLLAVDSYGTMSIYSNDCINWNNTRITDINPDTGASGLPFWHICYGDGKFVAVTEMSNDEMKGASAVSTDGINWTVTNLQLDLKLDMSIGGFGGFTDIAYGNGKFVVVAPEKHLLTSSDGITWNVTTTLPYLGYWKSIAHNGDKFVAIVEAGELEKPLPAYSDDGETWMISNDFSKKHIWTHIIEGNGKFIVISKGLGQLAFSDDGINWTYAKKSITTNYGENKTEDVKEILNDNYIASKEQLGVVRVGDGIDVDAEGVISVGSTPIPNNTDLNSLMTEGVYSGANADSCGYLNCPITNSNTFTLEVMPCGAHGQMMQRITTCDATNPRVWIRTYYSSTWFNWIPIIYDSGWNNAYSGYCMYRAKNGWCTVKGNAWGDYTLTKGEYKAISTIPTEYRPSATVYFVASSIGADKDIFGMIGSDGILYLYSNEEYSYWSYSVTYPIG